MTRTHQSRRPLRQFLWASGFFVVAIVTHTLLTDPHFGRPLFEQRSGLMPPSASRQSRLATVASPVSPDVRASGRLLRVSVEAPARILPIGGSLRLRSIGHFVSGDTPVAATWTGRTGAADSPLPECAGERTDCTVVGKQTGPFIVTASHSGLRSGLQLTVPATDGSLFRDTVPTWAAGSVRRLVDGGVIKGYEDGRYGAADPLTHGQVITLLQRSLGEADESSCDSPLAADHYARSAYCLFSARGWLPASFNTDTPATRGTAASYVHRIFAGRSTIAHQSAPSFTDVPASHPAAEDVSAAAALQIMTGHPDGRFGVDEILNRAEAAVMMGRVLDLLTE